MSEDAEGRQSRMKMERVGEQDDNSGRQHVFTHMEPPPLIPLPYSGVPVLVLEYPLEGFATGAILSIPKHHLRLLCLLASESSRVLSCNHTG